MSFILQAVGIGTSYKASQMAAKAATAQGQAALVSGMVEAKQLETQAKREVAVGTYNADIINQRAKQILSSQRAAAAAVKQSDWWSGGTAPLLDLQAASDPFKPADKRQDMKDEFGARVTIALVQNASHALIPEQPEAVVEALVAWIKTLP